MASRSSTTDGARAFPDHVLVGEVRGAHGLRGEVKVEVLSDVPGRWSPGRRLSARSAAGRRMLEVVAARPHRGGLLVRFAGVDSREAAEGLLGASLEVPRSEVPPAPEGTYYQFELIGCRCVDHAAGELGEVAGVVEDGGGQLLVVDGAAGELLVPFVARFVRRVAIDEGTIELELPPGLVETCASR